MFLLAVLSVVACAFAADPSNKANFHDTGNLLWRNCGGSDSWIILSKFDITPSPLRVPGQAELTLHATNKGPAINQNVVFDVYIKKRVLAKWIDLPCTGDIGTCRYVDICHWIPLIQSYFFGRVCPPVFQDNGLPCTCPFTIRQGWSINLNQHGWKMGAVKPAYTWLLTGEFYIKLQMYDYESEVARMCLEFYIDLHK